MVIENKRIVLDGKKSQADALIQRIRKTVAASAAQQQARNEVSIIRSLNREKGSGGARS